MLGTGQGDASGPGGTQCRSPSLRRDRWGIWRRKRWHWWWKPGVSWGKALCHGKCCHPGPFWKNLLLSGSLPQSAPWGPFRGRSLDWRGHDTGSQDHTCTVAVSFSLSPLPSSLPTSLGLSRFSPMPSFLLCTVRQCAWFSIGPSVPPAPVAGACAERRPRACARSPSVAVMRLLLSWLWGSGTRSSPTLPGHSPGPALARLLGSAGPHPRALPGSQHTSPPLPKDWQRTKELWLEQHLAARGGSAKWSWPGCSGSWASWSVGCAASAASVCSRARVTASPLPTPLPIPIPISHPRSPPQSYPWILVLQETPWISGTGSVQPGLKQNVNNHSCHFNAALGCRARSCLLHTRYLNFAHRNPLRWTLLWFPFYSHLNNSASGSPLSSWHSLPFGYSLFNPHSTTMRWVLVWFPFCSWENWGTKRWVTRGPGSQTQIIWFQRWSP